MSIPQRYHDQRATPTSRVLSDILLNRLAVKHGEEPELVKSKGLRLYRIGGRSYQLRSFSKSLAGELWTNFSPNQLEKIQACGASLLGIAYCDAQPEQLTLFRFTPEVLLQHYQEAGVQIGKDNAWDVRMKPGPNGQVVLIRSGMPEVVVEPGCSASVEHLSLMGEEIEAIAQARNESPSVVEIETTAIEEDQDMKSLLVNVSDAFELLVDCTDEAWEGCKLEIQRAMSSCKTSLKSTIDPFVELAGRIESFKQELCRQRDQWNAEFLPQEAKEEKQQTEEALEKGVAAYERTSWTVEGDQVAFLIQRPDGPPYKFVFPTSVVVRVADAICEVTNGDTSFKTSQVLEIVRRFVVQNTNYDSSPRTPVLCVINAGLKTGMLSYEPGYSRRYRITLGKTTAHLLSWAQEFR